MLKYWLSIGLALALWPIAAQNNEQVRYENRIYADDIRTVQLHLRGAPLSFPSLNVKADAGSLVLEFDLMSDESKDYMYSIIHCNADWTPSELETTEYLNGFTEDRILNFRNSQNTLTNYIHYDLSLPNRNIGWLISGNYILKVWEDNDEQTLVLTRRFMVVEPSWRVEAQIVKTAQVTKLNTHHEIDFQVVTAGTNVPNPQRDVKAYILQNARWDNQIGPMPPRPISQNGSLNYDYQDQIIFPAGKEFRFFDMQSLTSRGNNIRNIAELDDVYEVTLKPEKDYSNQVYQYSGDLNGRYSIENSDPNRTLMECDYAKVLFSILKDNEVEDHDVYIFGELSDWQLKPEFKMKYDQTAQVYWCEPLLKQGYYNYEFAVVDSKGKLDEDGFQGNWFETGNVYTIMVYFRPFGTRYDRLMVVSTIDSRRK